MTFRTESLQPHKDLQRNLHPDLPDHALVEALGPFGIQITFDQAVGSALEGLDHLVGVGGWPLRPEAFRRLIQSAPLVLFRGLGHLEREDLLRLCADDVARDLLHWDFGPVMEMKVQADARNYLFSREAVPFHWDGAFHVVPSYLVFHCLEAPDVKGGGETLFCDTETIWEQASAEEKESWRQTELTYDTEKKAHYGGRIRLPMVDEHPRTGRPILRFAEPVQTKLNPVSMRVDGPYAQAPEAFLAHMRAKIYDPTACYAHTWREGDVLVADNHSLIHGRNAFTAASPRHLRRIQIL